MNSINFLLFIDALRSEYVCHEDMPRFRGEECNNMNKRNILNRKPLSISLGFGGKMQQTVNRK